MDEGFEQTLPDGSALASRVTKPDAFYMTTGAAIPMTLETLEDVAAVFPSADDFLSGGTNIRFIETVYRSAVTRGLMDMVSID